MIVLGPIGFGVDFAIRRRRSSGAAISARASPTTSRRWSKTASHATAFAVRSSLGPRPSNRKVNEAAGLAERDASTPSGDAVANGTLNGRSSGVGITLRRLERFGFAPSDLVQRPRRRKRALRDARSPSEADLELKVGVVHVEGAPGMLQIARRARRCDRSAFRTFTMAPWVVSRAPGCSELTGVRGTEGSNPDPSSEESADFRFLPKRRGSSLNSSRQTTFSIGGAAAGS